MPTVQQLLIFLASPGDVGAERRHVDQVVEEINRTTARGKGLTLHVVRWDKHTFPGYGKDAQALVNAQIAKMREYDLFVGIMFNRVGTPTPRSQSGTIEEFERAARSLGRSGRPEIWFYFRSSKSHFNTEDQLQQRSKVLAFKKRLKRKGLPRDYDRPAEFRDMFRVHLLQWLEARSGKKSASSRSATRGRTPKPEPLNRGALRQPDERPRERGNPPSATAVLALPSSARLRRNSARATGSITSRTRSVSTSGTWVLLDDNFFQAASVNDRADATVVLTVPVGDAEQSAALRALRAEPPRSSNPIAFAYQNQAGFMHVQSVESESRAGKTVFTLALEPRRGPQAVSGLTEMSFNNYSADELAEMRTRLLLLDELPTGMPKRELEWLMPFLTGSDRSASAERGLFPRLWAQLKLPPSQFLPRARLAAVFHLKNSQTVEDILELKLGPISNDILPVRFRGRRRRRFDNEAPAMIEIAGECRLTR